MIAEARSRMDPDSFWALAVALTCTFLCVAVLLVLAVFEP